MQEMPAAFFHVSLGVINEALHLLHGRLVPGETADAQADTSTPCSVVGFQQDIRQSRQGRGSAPASQPASQPAFLELWYPGGWGGDQGQEKESCCAQHIPVFHYRVRRMGS